ncbi:glycosyltransferase family 4 protein [Adhaeribacter swui]|uniref:Glycosyltransferase family 4 protein n=1 Tax=Adhaeribacter swui TaxID=2086471 RepID=A0A7G7G585_9BACT|nr:glycosyltransferase family 4 protein [Adhaeribacter swui]QNF32319.1 glycosyltransferase family 4 protein [Adhaeribacter swui]
MKPRILFILHLPPPIHGAALVGQYIQESALINQTFDTTFIRLSTSQKLEEIGKGGLQKVYALFKVQAKVFRALKRKNYDLCYMSINSHGPGFYKDLLIVFLLKLFKKKIVYHFHNKGILFEQHKIFHKYLYRFSFKDTRSIILSKYLYPDVKAYVKEKDIFYLPNGIPGPSFKEPKLVEQERTSSLCRILFLSNMMAAKGVYVLLEACKLLKVQGLKFECHFVGSWFDISKEEFQDYLVHENLTEEVLAHGGKYGAEKFNFFYDSDIFVHPTLDDCFPLVLLEALSTGLPIVASEEGGIPDIVVEGETGFLVPKQDVQTLANKIKLLMLNPELRNKMAVAAKERFYKLFSFERFENNLQVILEKALKS